MYKIFALKLEGWYIKNYVYSIFSNICDIKKTHVNSIVTKRFTPSYSV